MLKFTRGHFAGRTTTPEALDVSELNLSPHDLEQLLAVDVAGWKKEADDVAANYARFDGKLPKALAEQLDALRQRLG